MDQAAAILLTVALFAIPAAIFVEHIEPEVWQSRLALFDGKDEVNRHTPLYAEGTFLPPRISENTTLTEKDNPVILPGRTEIPAGIILTVEEGVNIMAHEFAELTVLGTLRMQGTETQSIILTTNERHPQNQLWNGIIIESGGQAEISHAKFEYASPALTCLKNSRGTISNSEIRNALIGIFTNSPKCTASNNRIQTVQDNVISKF